MTIDLAQEARDKGDRIIPDLFCRSVRRDAGKLAPASAIADMAKEGAGFAGLPPGWI